MGEDDSGINGLTHNPVGALSPVLCICLHCGLKMIDQMFTNDSTKVSMNQVSIGSDNGLSPIRYQAIIWTNAGLLWIGHLGTNSGDIFIHSRKCIWKCLRNGGHFGQGGMG